MAWPNGFLAAVVPRSARKLKGIAIARVHKGLNGLSDKLGGVGREGGVGGRRGKWPIKSVSNVARR